MFASESGDQKSVESNSNSSTSTTIAAIPCKGCGKKANFLIVLDDDELECACGEPWEVPLDWYYCSKRCYSKNSYWMLQGSSLLVQDECNGCGCPQFFAVGVTMVPITREMIEDYAKEKSSSEEED
ncbi:hypothetical protein C9374_014096 [Naegleria lovaniensis]|uniref:Uncharacterized protein n=1 Tax=Naegleria lovaniensis TaxID=51637 RepID=A0AA88GW60_NAELO|nr:uncharacterized protein C9374_014096 [Naegleria lovaniensis]KAG2389536.1 hypothetical protein C9374_014096 [Naegleria lovaniensis]